MKRNSVQEGTEHNFYLNYTASLTSENTLGGTCLLQAFVKRRHLTSTFSPLKLFFSVAVEKGDVDTSSVSVLGVSRRLHAGEDNRI